MKLMIRGLEHLPHNTQAEKTGAVQPGQEEVPMRIQRGLTGSEGAKGKPERDSSSETLVIGQGQMSTN